MSAPVDQRSFITHREESWAVTTALWRGAMIERYARCEALVLKGLFKLRDAGFGLPAGSFSDGAPVRLRCLREVLNRGDLGTRAKHTLRLLETLARLTAKRAEIAHGSFRRHEGGLLIEWVCCRGVPASLSRTYSLCDMLGDLKELDKLSRDLSSEIGQICRAVADRAP